MDALNWLANLRALLLLGGIALHTTAFASSDAKVAIPTFPPKLKEPPAITHDCLQSARTLRDLELCRITLEAGRQMAEEYNRRVKKFCGSMLSIDATLRRKANDGKISWDDYDELKEEIARELSDCDANVGEYYGPYRARIIEYNEAIKLYARSKDYILKPIPIS